MIDYTQIISTLVGGVFSVLGIVATVLVHKYATDQRMAAMLENGLKNALGKLQQATEIELQNAALSLPSVPANVAPGVQYVLDHIPEALDHFGISPESVADKLVARIGVENIKANIAIAGSNNPLTPEPIAPVPANVEGPSTVKSTNFGADNGTVGGVTRGVS